ncbi:Smr domain containing protein [Ditylenchus destructor]|nr:Smr domain containing protein [Ditylenchus destructor]
MYQWNYQERAIANRFNPNAPVFTPQNFAPNPPLPTFTYPYSMTNGEWFYPNNQFNPPSIPPPGRYITGGQMVARPIIRATSIQAVNQPFDLPANQQFDIPVNRPQVNQIPNPKVTSVNPNVRQFGFPAPPPLFNMPPPLSSVRPHLNNVSRPLARVHPSIPNVSPPQPPQTFPINTGNSSYERINGFQSSASNAPIHLSNGMSSQVSQAYPTSNPPTALPTDNNKAELTLLERVRSRPPPCVILEACRQIKDIPKMSPVTESNSTASSSITQFSLSSLAGIRNNAQNSATSSCSSAAGISSGRQNNDTNAGHQASIFIPGRSCHAMNSLETEKIEADSENTLRYQSQSVSIQESIEEEMSEFKDAKVSKVFECPRRENVEEIEEDVESIVDLIAKRDGIMKQKEVASRQVDVKNQIDGLFAFPCSPKSEKKQTASNVGRPLVIVTAEEIKTAAEPRGKSEEKVAAEIEELLAFPCLPQAEIKIGIENENQCDIAQTVPNNNGVPCKDDQSGRVINDGSVPRAETEPIREIKNYSFDGPHHFAKYLAETDLGKTTISHQIIDPFAEDDSANSATASETSGEQNGHSITLPISSELIAILHAVFGDSDQISCEKQDVSVPLWLAEMLYKASQKMDVPEFFPRGNSPEADDEFRCDSPTIQSFQKTKQKPKQNEEKELVDSFCAIFGEKISKQMISKVAREHQYDPGATYDYLTSVSTAFDEVGKEPQGYHNPMSYYIPSDAPEAIFPENQESLNFTRDNFYDSLLHKYTMQDVELLRERATALRSKKAHYEKLEANNTSVYLRGVHAARARENMKEADRCGLLAEYIELCLNKEEHFIDLHYLTADVAMKVVRAKIDLCRAKYPYQRKLHVITGYGKTTGKPSTIKAGLKNFFDLKKIDYYQDSRNAGVLVVQLSGIQERLREIN